MLLEGNKKSEKETTKKELLKNQEAPSVEKPQIEKTSSPHSKNPSTMFFHEMEQEEEEQTCWEICKDILNSMCFSGLGSGNYFGN